MNKPIRSSPVALEPGSQSAGVGLHEVVHTLARRRSHRRIIRSVAVLGDMLVIAFAFILAAAFRYGDPFNEQAYETLAALLPVYLVAGVGQHAFTIGAVAKARVGSLKAVGSLLLAIGFIGLVTFFLQATGGVSRIVFGLGVIISIASLLGFRMWLAIYSHQLLGSVTINEVVIQDGVQTDVRKGSILLNALIDGLAMELDTPETISRLGTCLEAADRVIVACLPERRAQWTSVLKSSNVNAEIRAEELDQVGAIGISDYNGGTTLRVASAPLSLADRIQKRVLDLALVGILLPVVIIPMVLVAVAIKLTSKGPVFFRQPRVGLGNRVFYIYKFRSMRTDLGDIHGRCSTSRNDSRITRVGAFIRKTSIDELPQIINVLKGDMSVVGPRPHALESKAENRSFWDIDGRYWHRHAVKPGMTGLAQVRGFRGATERESDLVNRLQADLEYLSDWSIARDLAIIVSTFRVLIHENAF
ncbi:MAG: sugar transferase [Alphaproteobacteria bacterium]|nr:sugar transferase [Alphaproteobacteria bacterium]